MTHLVPGKVQAPTRTNLSAQIGLFSALIGLIPVALVFGFVGIHEVSRRPHESGSRLAWAAVALAVVEIIVIVTVGVILAVQNGSPSSSKTRYRYD